MIIIQFILALSFLIISLVLSIQGVMMIFDEKEENKAIKAKKVIFGLLAVAILVFLNFLLGTLLDILGISRWNTDMLNKMAMSGVVAGSVFSFFFLLIDKLEIILSDFFKGKKQFKILLPVCQCVVFSIALYFILHLFFGSVFAEFLTLKDDYLGSHPIPFILINCATFFLTQIILSKPLNKKKSRVARYIWFYLVWYVTTGLLGGLLGSYYDMEAGWYPEGGLFYMKIIDDMLAGVFRYGLYIVTFSIPYNIIALIGSFFILKYNKVLEKEQKNNI